MERRTLVVLTVAFAAAALTAPAACAERDRNILRNGSFEFANRYNGMNTLVDQGDELGFIWGTGVRTKWCDIGLEQWWGEGVTNGALYSKVADAFSGKTALRVAAPGAVVVRPPGFRFSRSRRRSLMAFRCTSLRKDYEVQHQEIEKAK